MKNQGQEGDRFFLSVEACSYSYSSSRPLLLLHSEPSTNTIARLSQHTHTHIHRHTRTHADLGDVGMEVGDEGVHGVGITSEGLGAPVDTVGKDSEAEVPSLNWVSSPWMRWSRSSCSPRQNPKHFDYLSRSVPCVSVRPKSVTHWICVIVPESAVCVSAYLSCLSVSGSGDITCFVFFF